MEHHKWLLGKSGKSMNEVKLHWANRDGGDDDDEQSYDDDDDNYAGDDNYADDDELFPILQ